MGDPFIVLQHRRRWHVITPTLHECIGTLDSKAPDLLSVMTQMKYPKNDTDMNASPESRGMRNLCGIHIAPNISYRPPSILYMFEIEISVPPHSSHAMQVPQRTTEPNRTHAHFDTRSYFPGENLSEPCCCDRDRGLSRVNTCCRHPSGSGEAVLCPGLRGR